VRSIGLPTQLAVDKDNHCLYQSHCPLGKLACDATVIAHTCDMAEGESGAPVLGKGLDTLLAIGLGVIDESENAAVVLDDVTVAWIDEVVGNL
jgi:V8-like Glu-specific endopeptidase